MTKIKSFIGIDLHKTTLTIGCLDSKKNVVGVKAIDTKCVDQIVDYVKSFPKPVQCAIESVGMYEWLWDLLEDEVDELLLVDAAEVKRRRKRGEAKTDKNDSLHIARLLVIDHAPVSYVPPKEYRNLRKLGRHYHNLSQILAEHKTHLRWILNQHNARGPSNLNSDAAQRWLLAHGHKLNYASVFTYEQQVQMISCLEMQKATCIRQMNLIAKSDQFKKQFEILRTVPGIGPVISFIILGEIADFSRFKKSDQIASYTGLTERTSESAGNRKPGNISRCGNATLSWALVEAATTLIANDQKYRDMHQRIVDNKGARTGVNSQKAKIAIAQKLIRYVWKMMQTGEPFKKGESTGKQAQLNAIRLSKNRKAS